MKSELEGKDNKLKEYEGFNADLKSQVDKLNAELAVAEKELGSLKQQCDKALSTIRDREANITRLERELNVSVASTKCTLLRVFRTTRRSWRVASSAAKTPRTRTPVSCK